jgi:hypothetical protein
MMIVLMGPTHALLLGALVAFGSGSPAIAGPPQPVSDDTTAVCASFLPTPEPLAGPYADFVRAAELMGAAPLRPHLIRRASTEWSPPICQRPGTPIWDNRVRETRAASGLDLELLPLHTRSEYNTAYPESRNNGALWAGRGLSTAVGTGLALRWGALSAALAPQLLYHQNRNFETPRVPLPPGTSPFAYPWLPQNIDWPVRFGDLPFRAWDLGQSYLRIDTHGVGFGLSNENLWWGPATRYPLLMSNTAPGFPHAFLGTSHPLATPVGDFEAQLIWGRLGESDYFDGDPNNDGRLLASVVLDYQPRWLPGLYLGAARSYLRNIPAGGLSFWDWSINPYRQLRENPTGDAADDQLFSLFARWAFPEVGFESYVEWGRNDHWGALKDLVSEPDHSQAYVLGFQKVSPAGANWFRLYGELAHLQASLPQYNTRGVGSLYTHGRVRHGYTHRGQLLGAGIGPGSDAQLLGADLITRGGRIGIFGERVRRDDDSYYRTWTRYYAMNGHDVELIAGVHQLLFRGEFDISWAASYAYRYNRNFVGLDGGNWDLLTESNLHLQLGLTWHPGPRLRRPLAAILTRD